MSQKERGVDPKQGAGDAKAAVQLVPPALMIGAARAFREGAAKYGAFNWRRTTVKATTYVAAILRHLFAYLDGENVDPESSTGKKHLEGAAASLAVLMDAEAGGFLEDDRPPPGPGARLCRNEACSTEAVQQQLETAAPTRLLPAACSDHPHCPWCFKVIVANETPCDCGVSP